jgi:CheY-like chemotaxis protein
MKADPSLQKIPVVILTSSKAEEDVARSYELHASAYVTKPLDLAGFGKIVRGIESFWLSVVSYPSRQ